VVTVLAGAALAVRLGGDSADEGEHNSGGELHLIGRSGGRFGAGVEKNESWGAEKGEESRDRGPRRGRDEGGEETAPAIIAPL
jgi:hypothetical protein